MGEVIHMYGTAAMRLLRESQRRIRLGIAPKRKNPPPYGGKKSAKDELKTSKE